MLIAEDLLLLLTDDTTGELTVSTDQVDTALAGALLVELALAGRVEPAGDTAGQVQLGDPAELPDPVLDQALRRVAAARDKRPAALLPHLAEQLRERLYQRLVDAGILRARKGMLLGFIPSPSWPTESADHERAVRAAITEALAHGRAADGRVAALVSLLHALRQTTTVIGGLDQRQAERNAEAIAAGDLGSAAVRQVVDETMAAVLAAVTVLFVTGTTS